ncbi:protein kinase domain-containing protein [Actinoallomurus soli]|uniref:protein kinase domain-containing protein n=1 Tax=Actinoallomurus soli TaxID=2952535 RepID=UPI002092EFD7|nr:protein kinase [Actinoallomurus soli]MCO5968316.1 protein kinase [Actinoallomurus soli]
MKRRGDEVGGYRLLTDPTNEGGANCMWAFAEKDGRQYFIKRFLEPKRPKDGSPANATARKLMLEECEEFEERHRSIMERLSHDMSGGGNLVLAVDLFHEGCTYYKVTERIETSSLEHPERLGSREKAILLRTLALSVQLLHGIDVVHGDLKPDNVLVQKKPGSPFHVAKLIDFDDSFISGRPPAREVIGGDQFFGAPEWRRYVQGDESVQPEHLTTATDVFALGLMIHYYLTGALPGHDDRFQFPADAVTAGEALRIDPRIGPVMTDMVRAMTARAPGARPDVAALLAALKDTDVCDLRSPAPTAEAPAARPSAGSARPAGSRVKKNLFGRIRGTPGGPGGTDGPDSPEGTEGTDSAETTGRTEPADPDRPTVSRVRINLPPPVDPGGRSPRTRGERR